MDHILSGIKPTGQLTLGNYIGAINKFVKLQDKGESFLFIADLHALTLPIDPEVLRTNSRDLAAFYLAAGLDPISQISSFKVMFLRMLNLLSFFKTTYIWVSFQE